MSIKHMLVWLEAPLQAWGYDSRFGRRDSLDFPTKSGVLGLFCCAMGAGGEQREWLDKWANVPMTVFAYVPTDRKGKPVPRIPLLQDFHTVGNGYDERDPWQYLLIPKKADGNKPNEVSGAKITYRYYIQDMAFAAIFSAEADQLEEVADALQNPVWDLYLGRKCCVPTEFIYQGVFDSKKLAQEKAETLCTNKNRMRAFTVLDGAYNGETICLNDVPVAFGPRKVYRDRMVTVLKNSQC